MITHILPYQYFPALDADPRPHARQIVTAATLLFSEWSFIVRPAQANELTLPTEEELLEELGAIGQRYRVRDFDEFQARKDELRVSAWDELLVAYARDTAYRKQFEDDYGPLIRAGVLRLFDYDEFFRTMAGPGADLNELPRTSDTISLFKGVTKAWQIDDEQFVHLA
jgi:hypothetical protein